MQEQITQLQDQINQLQKQFDKLRSSATLPLDVEDAFRTRIDPVTFYPSTKDAADETQSIDESGSATVTAAKPMDGFEERVVDGVTRYYPYYLA